MIFQHTYGMVIDGSKTQTRRLCKPGELVLSRPEGAKVVLVEGTEGVIQSVYDHTGNRLRWQVGKTYAVQPGRAKKGVARIEILSIKKEDVRDISEEDVKAEGFETASDFFITWVKMHDKDVQTPIIPDYYTGSIIWQSVRPILAERPAERYLAWALHFKLVEGGAK